MVVNVEVEYCGTCGYAAKFEEVKKLVLEQHPEVNIIGVEGRRASFEVKINDTLVHSKLSTMAFPNFQEVSNIVTEVSAGHEVRKVSQQQAITDCVII